MTLDEVLFDLGRLLQNGDLLLVVSSSRLSETENEIERTSSKLASLIFHSSSPPSLSISPSTPLHSRANFSLATLSDSSAAVVAAVVSSSSSATEAKGSSSSESSSPSCMGEVGTSKEGVKRTTTYPGFR